MAKSLGEFLYKGHYDNLYSSEELILVLCSVLNFNLIGDSFI
ncbi:hypothetical protein [Campylobacter blaseri]|nr:hypothetical protein [Campylobacter blaseri]